MNAGVLEVRMSKRPQDKPRKSRVPIADVERIATQCAAAAASLKVSLEKLRKAGRKDCTARYLSGVKRHQDALAGMVMSLADEADGKRSPMDRFLDSIDQDDLP